VTDAPPPAGLHPPAGTRRPRALLLRQLGLGDLLAGVPALRAVRRGLPDHEVLLAAPEALRPLVELTGAVDTLVPTGELEPVPWTGPPPEVAIDLHGSGPASRVLLDALRPGRTVAFAGGPPWDPDEQERERWCRLVTWGLGVPADPDDVLLPPPPVAPPVADAVVIPPGAASGSRRWPPERFAAVARWAVARGERVVVTGGPAEVGLAETVRRQAGLPADAVVAGRTDLAALAALVAAARLVVCGDTGVAHLASAYATPSVLLFGPTPPHRWGPPRSGPHSVLWHGTGVGDPHGSAPDPALLKIRVGDVIEQAELRLREGRPRPRPATPPRAAGRAGAPPTRSSA
jgi:ADP-heptose:LPS heptosyltransferase